MTILWIVFSIILCLASAAFFAGSEIAFFSVNRIKLKLLAEKKHPSAIQVQKFLEQPRDILITTLAGNNVSQVAGTALLSLLVYRLLGAESGLMVTLIMTPVALIFSELIPKALFRQRANTLILKLAGVFNLISRVLYPVIVIVTFLTDLILIPFRRKEKIKKDPFVNREELMYLIAEGEREGVLSSYESSIVRKIFDLGRTKVKRIIVEFNRVSSLSSESTVGELKTLARKTRFSRFPVYRQEQSNIVGLVNILDTLFETNDNLKVTEFIRPILAVSAGEIVDDVFYKLQSKKESMALVSENNKNIGIVTIEDLVPI
ncbi:MAG: CNNM domain-containing protein [Candidatus Omnitrophota bacterium]|nr:CNNM domain-containing protein [Candidatus Omnitrophota bacterium]